MHQCAFEGLLAAAGWMDGLSLSLSLSLSLCSGVQPLLMQAESIPHFVFLVCEKKKEKRSWSLTALFYL
jgi:hypothetical protein